MTKPKPINILDLMPKIDSLLIKLLDELSLQEWDKQTIAPKWKVKDIAVHLLDGNLRTLSMLRDKYYGEQPENIHSYQDLVDFLNQLNSDWVKATKRLSPKVIVELLKTSGKEYCDYLATLDPSGQAAFSVAWAGETESKNWFHIAREYTEKWHHQQQIRLAVGREAELLKDEWYFPYLDTSIRALPHHYRDLVGEKGDLIKFVFKGASEKYWYLRFSQKWELFTSVDEQANCEVIIPDEVAWKIFTKGIKKEQAILKSEINGKREIGLKFFEMITVMA